MLDIIVIRSMAAIEEVEVVNFKDGRKGRTYFHDFRSKCAFKNDNFTLILFENKMFLFDGGW